MRLKLHTAALSALVIGGCDTAPPPFTEIPSNYSSEVSDQISSDDLTGYSTLASAQWTLEASQIKNAEVEFDLTAETVKQFGKMDFQTAASQIEHVQVNRPQSVEVFQQGTDQQSISEFFKQNENDDAQGLLDILIVIDNSGSMAEEQNNLATKLLPLLTYVEESDWKIGVVTTDEADGCMRDVISKGQNDLENSFASAIRAGVNGSGVEAGIPQAVAALSPGCVGAGGWLRPNSTLAVLIVSDEDNCSDGTQCAISEHNSADYLLDHLRTIREPGVNAKVFGLVWHATEAQSQCTTAYRQANVYSDLIDATSGTWGSICDSDYSQTLQAMSMDLSLILKTQFALNFQPFFDSIEVTINGVKLLDGYTITGNVIEFAEAPAPGSRIYVNYRFTTADPQDRFTLAAAADPAAMAVYLDGNKTDSYTYDSASREVVFARAPQAREIKVTYRNPGDLQTQFQVENGLTKAAIGVTVNGTAVSQTAYSYGTDTGLISFVEAPKDGAVIRFDYEKVIGPELTYAIFAPEEALDSVWVTDGFGQVMDVAINGRTITFAEAEFTADREFVISYDNINNQTTVLDLGFAVYGDSLKVSGQLSGDCAAATQADSAVDIRGCNFASGEIISMSFDFVKSHQTSFVLEDSGEMGVEEILNGDYAYQVKVNDEVVQNYSIDGNELSFDELPIGAMIQVKLFRGNDS